MGYPLKIDIVAHSFDTQEEAKAFVLGFCEGQRSDIGTAEGLAKHPETVIVGRTERKDSDEVA